MHGSVWEWCSDFYSPTAYKNSPTIDPTGPKAGRTRVARGGCWSSPVAVCASAYRNANAVFPPNEPLIGFRVVVEVRGQLP
jgi:formylglycine-generating enzyme required for sulfatase activity